MQRGKQEEENIFSVNLIQNITVEFPNVLNLTYFIETKFTAVIDM